MSDQNRKPKGKKPGAKKGDQKQGQGNNAAKKVAAVGNPNSGKLFLAYTLAMADIPDNASMQDRKIAVDTSFGGQPCPSLHRAMHALAAIGVRTRTVPELNFSLRPFRDGNVYSISAPSAGNPANVLNSAELPPEGAFGVTRRDGARWWMCKVQKGLAPAGAGGGAAAGGPTLGFSWIDGARDQQNAPILGPADLASPEVAYGTTIQVTSVVGNNTTFRETGSVNPCSIYQRALKGELKAIGEAAFLLQQPDCLTLPAVPRVNGQFTPEAIRALISWLGSATLRAPAGAAAALVAINWG
jgi:hypothetical protein